MNRIPRIPEPTATAKECAELLTALRWVDRMNGSVRFESDGTVTVRVARERHFTSRRKTLVLAVTMLRERMAL